MPDDKPSNWSAAFYWITADNKRLIQFMVLVSFLNFWFGPDEILTRLDALGVWADNLPIQLGGLE